MYNAAIALSILFLGAPAIWVLPVAFPVVMAAGGLIGLLGFPLPGVEIAIAAGLLMFGSVARAVGRRRQRPWQEGRPATRSPNIS